MRNHKDQSTSKKEKKRGGLARRILRIFSRIFLGILVIILVGIAGLFIYEPSPAKDYFFSSLGETIQLSDGRTLAYFESGPPEGRPVFYFHGGPGSRLEGLFFDELNQQLGIRMIAVDRPGYGLSDFQTDRTYLDWPHDISELADQLGIDRFAVIGWSSGGPYAAAVAHGIPHRLTTAVIVAGEGPYASNDYPQSVLTSATFNGSGANQLFIWSANNGQWLMRTLFTIARILLFRDPAGFTETDSGFDMSVKDRQFFTQEFQSEFSVVMLDAFRQGVDGVVHDYTIERLDWPFTLEDIQAPTVLVFHGEDDTAVHPQIGEYVCMRISSCDEPTIFPGEGHSIVYYRYKEIVQAMLEVWE